MPLHDAHLNGFFTTFVIHIVFCKLSTVTSGFFYAFTVHKAILPFITIAGNQTL